MSGSTITGEEIQEAHEKIREVLRGLVWLADVVKATLFPAGEGLVCERDRDSLARGLETNLPQMRAVFEAAFRLPRGSIEVFTAGSEPVALCGRRGINGHEVVLRVAGNPASLLRLAQWEVPIDALFLWEPILDDLNRDELWDFDAILSIEHRRAMEKVEGTPAKHTVPSLPPLTEGQALALELIRTKGPVLGKELAAHLGVQESTVTSRYIPSLKAHGVKNKKNAGYYLDPPDPA